MMMQKKILFLLPLYFLLTACTTSHPQEYTYSALWLHHAGESRALQYQAFNLAKLRLDAALKNYKGKKPLAVVVDIDETILDNSRLYAREILANKSYHPKTWTAWVKEKRATPIPGSLEFLRYAHQRGIAIFYVSNRMQQEELEPTYENLKAAGFPVKHSNLLFRADTSSKKARRSTIEKTHHIVLLLGDNLSDFSSMFDKQSVNARNKTVDQYQKRFGYDFIVLPNPVYGDWETAFYNHKHSLSDAQKHKIRQDYLRSIS